MALSSKDQIGYRAPKTPKRDVEAGVCGGQCFLDLRQRDWIAFFGDLSDEAITETCEQSSEDRRVSDQRGEEKDRYEEMRGLVYELFFHLIFSRKI